MSARRDLTQDLFKMMDDIRTDVDKTPVFMGLAYGFNKYDIVEQIDKLRASMPREFRDAASIAREADRMIQDAKQESEAILAEATREAERLLAEANAEAERTVAQARLKHEQLTSEHEVVRVATQQGVEIRQSADRESRQLRREADRYAHEVLSRLEGEIAKLLSAVERGRKALSTDTAVSTEPEREKARV